MEQDIGRIYCAQAVLLDFQFNKYDMPLSHLCGILFGVMILQTSRLFEIIYLLLNKDRVTAKELAERFGVSSRTIYRDIDTISLAGIPVYTEKGKGGGISLLPDFVLNKSILSEQEQGEILASLQGLTQIQSGDADRVLQKLSAVFNKTAAKWLEVDFSDWSFEQQDLWGGFKSAILQKQVVEFDYYNSYSEKTHRRAEPIQLWFKSKTWYLKAYDLSKCGIRLFRLSRVRNMRITAETFAERNPLIEETITTPSIGQRPDVALRLRIKPEMAHRVLDEFAGLVDEQEADGSYIVSLCWPEDNWVYGTILSFGEYIEVLEPERIRAIIRDKAKKIYEQYL
ncbi:MAG: YafY family transcriptional regulator [Oscillospiraceae bacterium]|nr:YafY family transcriptional regulator [Oscillospiraceae bacterium]